MRKERMNEKGLTLVEILAALTILGIVFISFMTIFPQMTNFNSRTEAKLETMNLAKQELLDLKAILKNQLYPDNILINDLGYTKINDETYQIVKDHRGKGFTYVVTLAKTDELELLNKESRDKGLTYTALHKMSIDVTRENKSISQTHGYIEVTHNN